MAAQQVATRWGGKSVLNIAAWIAQALIALIFALAGVMKMFKPIPELSAMMAWTGQLPTPFVKVMGAVDMAGAIGILLPALLGVMPRLMVPAAIGCTTLQVCATVFHMSRGEFSLLPLNAVLLVLSVFTLWVRAKKAPVG